MDRDIEQAGDYGAPIREHRDATHLEVPEFPRSYVNNLHAEWDKAARERDEARAALAAAEHQWEMIAVYRDHSDGLYGRVINALAIVDGYPGNAERKPMPWMNVCALRAALAGDSGEAGNEHH